MVKLTVSSDSYDIIKESGILECEGVTENKIKEVIPGPMGETGGGDIVKEITELLATTKECIKALTEIIVALINKERKFTLEVDGKKVEFKNYSKKDVISILEVALQGA